MKEDRAEETYDEIDLYDYLRVIWRWRWMIAIGVIVATLAAIPAAYLMRTYKSQGVLRLGETLQSVGPTKISKQGNKGIIVSLPEYMIYSIALKDSRAFRDYLNRSKRFSSGEKSSVQGLKGKSVLGNIKPLYAYSEDELLALRLNEQFISAIQLSWEGSSPELAQRMVDAMGHFVKEVLEKKIMEKYVNQGYQDAYTKVQDFERNLIDLRFSLKQKEQKLAELKKIAQRLPKGEQLSSREVVSVEKGGHRYLPPTTQMVAVQVEIADNNLAIARTERLLKVDQLKLDFFAKLKEVLQKKVSGGLFNRLEEITDEFFKDKDINNDEVLIVRNEISSAFTLFEHQFNTVMQFISGPTLPQKAKPSKQRVAVVTFFLSLFFFTLLAFFLEFIQQGKLREKKQGKIKSKK